MKVTFLGHSSVQIEQDGRTILTDPVLSARVLWLRRLQPLPADPSSLQDPAAIFISHSHYDHLDLPSFKYVSSKAVLVVPKRLKQWLSRFLPNPIVELDHGESAPITKEIWAGAVAVQHCGGRLDAWHLRPANGYLIRWGGRGIFFPGDSAYRPDFKEQLVRLRPDGPIDVALMPIGCYRPEWFMKSRHMDPREAVQVFDEIGAQTFIPIHWGTFRLSTEPVGEPITRLQKIRDQRDLGERVRILQPGESALLD